jgi:hypothetical protein
MCSSAPVAAPVCFHLQLLRRLLRAGSPVDIGDYDKRTALHISAAEGNAVMVSSAPWMCHDV